MIILVLTFGKSRKVLEEEIKEHYLSSGENAAEKNAKLIEVINRNSVVKQAETDRIIELKEFNYTSEYKNNNHLYWVLYNEDITEENFKTDNVFVITTIN